MEGRLQRWRPTIKKLSKFAAAGRWLAGPQALVTGQEVERFVGHAVHLLGLRTELMCLPHTIYTFIRKRY